MLRFRRKRCSQNIADIHASIHNFSHTNQGFNSRTNFKLDLSAARADWCGPWDRDDRLLETGSN